MDLNQNYINEKFLLLGHICFFVVGMFMNFDMCIVINIYLPTYGDFVQNLFQNS